ncbi:hypothetical protein [Henriciella mobilis]|uniref:Uncharacterized protein n=1 Tax=Henriciella mobilis TaxID=2305467 RepID=A0A399RJM4_9PROT|nr:hypothetical protein [Henriciella mobilis]RIJ30197.1 hypothetical protein D1223_05985 [Henriciella mobilis]
MTHAGSRIAVTLLFALIYLAFLFETGVLVYEFGPDGLALQMATMFAHNFLFFPVAGALALIAFWRPAVLIVDALAAGRVPHGRITLIAVAGIIGFLSWSLSNAFAGSNTRSLFEVAPDAIVSDEGVPSEDPALRRAAIGEVLIQLKINAASEGGLQRFQSRCEDEWLRYGVAAQEQKLCFPTGTVTSIEACCRAKTDFRARVNAMEADHPSLLASVHRYVLPVKMVFLLTLLFIGILLVWLRKPLTQLYGKTVQQVSFPLAAGGALVLLWPLMNAAYLSTSSLLTGDGLSNAYRITAPLFALGFGVWAMLLIFFHLRTYPSHIETALKSAGAIAAAIGVFRYEDIVNYLSRTLGVGGGLVAVIVFTVAVGALIAAVLMGVKAPEFLDPKAEDKEDPGLAD